jgi:hypothetical protein
MCIRQAGTVAPSTNREHPSTDLFAMRTRLLAIPTTATPRVMAARDAAETLTILRSLVHEALSELANVKIDFGAVPGS